MAENPQPPNPSSPVLSPKDEKPSGEIAPMALAGLGVQFFAAILVFVYAGNWLDRRFGTAPLFLLGGVLLGGGGVFYATYRRLMATTNASERDRPAGPANGPRS